MKHTRLIHFAAIATLAAALGLVADARASYSGSIHRHFCPSGTAFLPQPDYWIASGCSLRPNPALMAAGAYVHAYISPPYENKGSATSTTVVLKANGTDHAGGKRVCTDTYAYDSSGNWSASSSTDCTIGSTPSDKSLTTSVTVPVGGHLLTDVWAQPSGIFRHYDVAYTAGGT